MCEAAAYLSHGDARAAARRAVMLQRLSLVASLLLGAALASGVLWVLSIGACIMCRLAWALLLLPPRILGAALRALLRGGAWLLARA